MPGMKNTLTIRTEKFPRPPDKRENARRGRAGAVSQKADRLFTTNNSRNSSKTQLMVGPRFEGQVVRVHALGPRCLAELLAEIATATRQLELIADRVEAYAGLEPEKIRFVGADRFPPSVLGVVR